MGMFDFLTAAGKKLFQYAADHAEVIKDADEIYLAQAIRIPTFV